MKRLVLLPALLLFACSGADEENRQQAAPPSASPQPQARVHAAEPLTLECAIGGGTFARACMVDQAAGEDGVTLTIRNPQGGFRRLLVTPEGEVAAADGAEPAEATLLGDGRVEVAIGGDLYRIPAPAGFAARTGR